MPLTQNNPHAKVVYLEDGFPGGSDGKEPACNAGGQSSIPGLGRSPGEGNAAHSSFLAWRILWTETPVGLQSMGSQRIGHDWVTNTFTFFSEPLKWQGEVSKGMKGGEITEEALVCFSVVAMQMQNRR